MNIVNFILWLILVFCGGVGVGSVSSEFNNYFIEIISLVLYIVLVAHLASVLHPWANDESPNR